MNNVIGTAVKKIRETGKSFVITFLICLLTTFIGIFVIISSNLTKSIIAFINSHFKIQQPLEQIDIQLFIVIILATVSICTLISFILFHSFKSPFRKECQSSSKNFSENCKLCRVAASQLNDLKDHLVPLIGAKSLITHTYLSELEKNVPSHRKIRVLTSDLSLEQYGEFKDIIVNNLIRGIEYEYLIPINIKEDFGPVAKNWQNLFKTHSNKRITEMRLHCKTVQNEMAYMTILAYGFGQTDCKYIIKFPGSKDFKSADFPFHFELPETAELAREKFKTLLNNLWNEGEEVTWQKN